ncbi:MAG: methyltransferase [Firmicutes bacterium]|nr:methyltransferase [Bacillota bacterium]
MSHYYQFDEKLKSLEKTITYRFNDNIFTFITDQGVFSKDHVDHGSDVLLHAIHETDVSSILDIGCGYGVLGCVLKTLHPNAKLTMFDINPRAVQLAKKNTEHLKDVLVLESSVVPGQGYDLAVINPPIRAGKSMIFSLYQQAFHALEANGILYVVISKRHGAPSTVVYLKTMFDEVSRVNKAKGYDVYKAIKY